MLAEAYVGLRNLADGVLQGLGINREGALLTSALSPDYAELARRGLVFAAVTGAAGVAPGTALSTTPPFTLYNPQNSGKILVPTSVRVGYLSGTLGAGTIFYCGTQQTATPSGGTALTAVRTDFSAASGAGKAFQGSTLQNTPVAIAPGAYMGPALATTVQFPALTKDYLDGAIVVPPGNVFTIQMIGGAGTAPLVFFGVKWAELVYP